MTVCRAILPFALLVLPVFAQPSITPGGVVNATGYQNTLAPGAVFVVFGQGLGAPALSAAYAPDYPATLGGTSITFTPVGGGAPINARMAYAMATQAAGLLPSSAAPGDYTVRVAYNNQTSAPATVTVAARSFGIATAGNDGTGPAQATIGNLNGGLSLVRFASGSMPFGGATWQLAPAHGGDTLVFWGTGGGADPANDTGGSSGDQTAAGNFAVKIGDRTITPSYAGTTAGYPGLWQVNFTLPADIAPTCFAQAQVMAGGEAGNTVSIAIAGAGQASCADPNLPPNVLAKIAANGDVTIAAFGVYRVTDQTANFTTEGASGGVLVYKAANYALNFSGPHIGPCYVHDRTYAVGGRDPASPEGNLDAGARLPLAGPNLALGAGLVSFAGPTGPSYLFLPAANTFQQGTYTLTGNGGSQVGPFSASADFPASFTVTNFDSIASVNRSQPLTINWTGPSSGDVLMLVNSAQQVGTSQHIVTLTCTVPASLGSYTIPAEALGYLLPVSSTFGTLAVEAQSESGLFTATLAAGGQTDIGVFGTVLGVEKSVPIQ